MNIEALVLIEDDKDAQRLVVTWPQVGQRYERAQAALAEEGGVAAFNEVRLEWARISGVYEGDVDRLEPILFANGLLGPAGTVEGIVMAFIRSRIARMLPKPARQKAGQDG